MNVTRVLCCLLLSVLCVGAFLMFAGVAPAAEGASRPVLQANFVYEFAADRGRMIQLSLVFVAVGCAIIWWYK